MSSIIVVGFDSEDDARAALDTLHEVEKDGGIKFDTTALVAMDADGKVHVKNQRSGSVTTGAVMGGVLGGLLFVVFPVAGVAAGAAVGAGLSAAVNPKLSKTFRDEIAAELTPGKAALFMQIEEGGASHAVKALEQYHGRVIQTSLDSETEEQLRTALS